MKVGDIVRVKNPDGFVSSIRNKVKDRTGTIIHLLPIQLSSGERARVLFHKRNGRGKEFEEVFRISNLELVKDDS